MLGRQILKSRFGKHYKIHFIKDGPVPCSLRPLRFSGSYSARRFLQELQVSASFWSHMARTSVDAAPLRNHHSDHLQVICNSILFGRMRIYEVELPDTHALSRSTTAVQDRQGYQYQFVPMRQALAIPGRTPQRFTSAQQVYETLYDLAPNLEQLQALAANLQFTPALEQQTYTQLIEALAEELAEQRIALYIAAPFKRPEATGVALESATNMPGNRKVELAPATPAARTDSASVVEVPDKKLDAVTTQAENVPDNTAQKISETAYLKKIERLESIYGSPNVHSLEKHGAQTTGIKQYRRVQHKDYPNPTTGAPGNKTKTASKFLTNKDHYEVLRSAILQRKANPEINDFDIVVDRDIGVNIKNLGSHKNRGPYSVEYTNTARVRFDPNTGKIFTAFPIPEKSK